MQLYRYSVKYRRYAPDDVGFRTGRTWHMTVTASSADDARRMAAIKDPEFGTTVETPRRRGLVVAEDPDGMDQAKAREFARWRDTDVEVV